MPIYLKQSTASQEIPLGVFVDDTDGKTAETGLTIANTDIKLWKAGGTTLANKNSGGATHIAGGIYYAVLDATDTDTLGPLVIFVHVSGALPVRVECAVTTANWYDTLHGTDVLDASVTQWTGTAVATPDTAGYPKVTLKSGTGTGEVSLSSGAVLLQATQTGVTIPTVTSITNGVTIADATSDAVIADAVWNAATATYGTAGTYGEKLEAQNTGSVTLAAVTHTGAVIPTVTTLTNAPSDSSGTTTLLSRIVGTLGVGTHTAQTGDAYTVANAIKAKTDFLPSATAGAAGGLFIAGTNEATTIVNSSGNALTLSSSGGNGHGLFAQGNGTGSGITGSGGGTSGNGIYAAGDGTGMGIYATGGDGSVSAGIKLASNAATTKYGLLVEDGATITSTFGTGLTVSSSGTDQHGMVVTGNGTGGDIVADITGNVSGSVGSVTGAVGSVTGAVGSVTGSVGSVATGGITAASFAAGAIGATVLGPNCIGSSELATDAINAIADGLLDRNMATGTDSGSATVRTPRQALRFLRNKWSTSGVTLTVTKEDDTTTSWAAELTSSAAAEPITAVDPASS